MAIPGAERAGRRAPLDRLSQQHYVDLSAIGCDDAPARLPVIRHQQALAIVRLAEVQRVTPDGDRCRRNGSDGISEYGHFARRPACSPRHAPSRYCAFFVVWDPERPSSYPRRGVPVAAAAAYRASSRPMAPCRSDGSFFSPSDILRGPKREATRRRRLSEP